MAEDALSSGALPSCYRDVYDAVCPGNEDKLSRTAYRSLLTSSGLSASVQNQIIEVLKISQGPVPRIDLYRTFALIAFAQKGHPPSSHLLEVPAKDLPQPELGSIKHLRQLSGALPSDEDAVCTDPLSEDPTILTMNFEDLKELDTVGVELIPEKKGLFLKHVEYEITSRRFRTTVYRRYNDFVTFQEMLLQRFPYRLVPSLPPKKMLRADREFIEARRKALQRFTNLVARHPVMSRDSLVHTFHTVSGNDLQNKLKDCLRSTGDEFMSSSLATQAKELVPTDFQARFASSRDKLRMLTASAGRLRDQAERVALRAVGNATDLQLMGKEMSILASNATPGTGTQNGCSATWGVLKRTLKSIPPELTVIADKASQQGKREDEDVVEKLNYLMDLLHSFKELCDRHERGVLHDHQKALQKYGSMKKQMMSTAIQGREPGAVEQLESRIVQQETAIVNMEQRNYYSLFCLHLETQLIHVNLDLVAQAVCSLVSSQAQGHREMKIIWEELQPKLHSVIQGCNGTPSSPLSNLTPSPSFPSSPIQTR
uniref:sorting nexin-8-like n=2 Tax=Myxine glutinosa TaxID=7769 RepID=UPI00358ECD23